MNVVCKCEKFGTIFSCVSVCVCVGEREDESGVLCRCQHIDEVGDNAPMKDVLLWSEMFSSE